MIYIHTVKFDPLCMHCTRASCVDHCVAERYPQLEGHEPSKLTSHHHLEGTGPVVRVCCTVFPQSKGTSIAKAFYNFCTLIFVCASILAVHWRQI